MPTANARSMVKPTVNDYKNCKNESYLIRNCSVEARQRYESQINLPLPTHIDIFPIREDHQEDEKPMMNYLISRNIYKFNEIKEKEWEEFGNALTDYEAWAKLNVKWRLEMGVASKLTEEEKAQELDRAKRI